jgi:broad specificity phosphatase PhoE
MATTPPALYIVRHGETAWSLSGQHTGRTDIPLTERGDANARRLGERLKSLKFALVLTSPLQRARRTCDLAGYAAVGISDSDLMEWDYGDFEGRRTAEIHQLRPGWDLFRDGCPNGENAEQVGVRVDRVLRKVRAASGDSLIFSHGHLLRVLAARWLSLPPTHGRYVTCSAGSLGILSYEHASADEPVISLWNDTNHLET